MANFVLVSPSTGFGNSVIKVKPNEENTSTTDEKKGKLVIKVNGEIQKTIPLSQAIKGSTGGDTKKTLVSREINLNVYDGYPTSTSSNNSLNSNAQEGSKKLATWYFRNTYYYYDLLSDNDVISAFYSVTGQQIDYLSDGSQEYTNLLPAFLPHPEEDTTGTQEDFTITYSGDSVSVDEEIIAGYNLSIDSKKLLRNLSTVNKIYGTFLLASKTRSDIEDNYKAMTIQLDVVWTFTVTKGTITYKP